MRGSSLAAYYREFVDIPNSKPLQVCHLVQPKKMKNDPVTYQNTSSGGVVGSSRGPTNEVLPEFIRWRFAMAGWVLILPNESMVHRMS